MFDTFIVIKNRIMNRLIYSCMLSCFFLAVCLTSSIAQSTEPANKVDQISINSVNSDDHFDEMVNDISLKETYQMNETQASLDGLILANTPIKNKFSQIKVAPSSGSYLGACEDDEYYVQISGASFGDGWDISSVTICGVEVCQILMQSANYVLVYPNSGMPGTGDIVITSKSMGKTTLENAYTYNVPATNKQVRNIQ
jgi:hypothetical protein